MATIGRIPCVVLMLLLAGCSMPAKIAAWGGTKVRPPANASAPSVVNSGQKTAETVIPAGTVKTVTETAATAAEPARTVTVYSFPTETRETATETVQNISVSNERAPDQTVALKKADNEARAPLLWIAAACGLVGLIVAVVLKYPVIGGMIALLGGGGAFAAWKLAEVPGWIWGVGLFVAFVAWAFYTRGQWDKNGNGVPDILEKT